MTDHPSDRPFDRAASSIDCSTVDGSTYVRLSGEIDVALRDHAGEAMVFVVDQNNPVIIDVSQVAVIDSSGLAFLVQLHRLCQESGLPHVLRDPDDNLLDLLDVLGMSGQFDIVRSAGAQVLHHGA